MNENLPTNAEIEKAGHRMATNFIYGLILLGFMGMSWLLGADPAIVGVLLGASWMVSAALEFGAMLLHIRRSR